MKCPVFIQDLVEAMFALALDEGVLFLLIGFSRGSVWGAWLAKKYPQHFDGMLLIGLYPTDESNQEQEALDLIRAVPRLSVLHALKDDHSTLAEHEPYWLIVLGAEEGDAIENKVPHFKTWVCMADHANSRNCITEDFPECLNLRRALWDNMVLPGDYRLAYKDQRRTTTLAWE